MKLKFRFTIARKLAFGFGILMIAVLVTSVMTYTTLDTNMRDNNLITKLYNPSAQKLNDLVYLITNSKMLIKNWIYIDKKDTKDKERLRELHITRYPEVKRALEPLVNQWSKPDQTDYANLIKSIDTLFGYHQEIMSQLNSFDSYENIMVMFVIMPRVDEKGDVIELTDRILDKLSGLKKRQDDVVENSNKKMESSFGKFQNLIFIMGIILAVSVIIIAAITTRTLVVPINYIKQIILSMAKGHLPKEKIKATSDEIGEMADALNVLVDSLQKTSEFALRIGEGNFESEFTPLSNQDVLGNSLMIMRENLKKAAVDEDRRNVENLQRNWAAQGIAKFSEILRQNNTDMEKLSFEVISNLVKYLDANMGGFFIINDTDKNDTFIELTGTYAYTRQKFIKRRIEIGVTLVGQCVQEGETIYLTDIPKDYIKITSGLGDDNPTSLLIVPLKINTVVYGVVELASFNAFERYQIEFVERIGETVASTISTVRVNMNTSMLLKELQEKSDRMAEQEDEVRRNIESMRLSHEENLNNAKREKLRLGSILNALNSSVGQVEFNLSGEILNANEKFAKLAGMKTDELKGKHHSEFMSKERINSLEYQNFWSDLNNGIVHSGGHQYFFGGVEKWFYEIFTPVRDEDGYFYKVISLSYDITKVREKEEKLKRQVDKANLEIERLRARNNELERMRS